MKSKLILIGLCMLLILPMISAEVQDLGTVKQGDCITLRQKYANSTYTNITTITYPNKTEEVVNIQMTGSGGIWSYDFCDTLQLGDYEYCTRTDVDGVDTDVCTSFSSTPSGQSGNANIVFYVFIIVMLYGINLFGFFGKNEIMTIIGGMVLLFLGVYLVNYGVIIFRDNLTNYLAYVTIAWGAVSSMWATFSLMDVI
jgi:hypothetical protein